MAVEELGQNEAHQMQYQEQPTRVAVAAAEIHLQAEPLELVALVSSLFDM
jgi:hypothetical protein